MSMPIEQGGIVALLLKYKVFAYLASFAGAVLIAMTRPPQTRKELFYHAAAAMLASYLFGDVSVAILDNWLSLTRSELIVPVYGLIGAMGWGIAGGLSSFSTKFAKDPIQAVKDVKDLV